MRPSLASAGLGRLDRVGARLGDGEAQVVETVIAERRFERRGRGDDEPDECEVVRAGRDLQLDLGHGAQTASAAIAPAMESASTSARSRRGDLEHLEDPVGRARDAQIAAQGPGPLEAADDDAQPRGVDEVDALEVEHQPAPALA